MRASRIAGDLPPRQPKTGWLRLLLALSLAVVALSVVGMHQLSVGHEVATRPPSPSAHAAHSAAVSPGTHSADSAGRHATGGVGGAGSTCPDCDDHEVAFGSCLLALTLLVLSWMLAGPRLRHLPPFLLPRRAPRTVGPAVGRLVPSLSLAELSLRRT